jgi:hypothetical protein
VSERQRILEQIERGEISVEEGAQRLEALVETPQSAEVPEASEDAPAPAQFTPPAWVDAIRYTVLSIGALVLAWGGYLLTQAYTTEGAGSKGWGWFLFILGALGVLFGWWLRNAHWMAVRVRQPDGPNVNIALPLPLSFLAWGLRIVGPFVPQLEETGVDELLVALREELTAGRPFVVEVEEGEEGEQVEVYFA